MAQFEPCGALVGGQAAAALGGSTSPLTLSGLLIFIVVSDLDIVVVVGCARGSCGCVSDVPTMRRCVGLRGVR